MKRQFAPTLSALLLCLVFPFAESMSQEAPTAAPDDAPRSDDFAACVRGRVITRLEVEAEVERLRKMSPSTGDEELRWEARRALAEHILLVETAKTYLKMIPDDMIRREYLGRGLDENTIRENFTRLKEEFFTTLYVRARLGWTDQIPGVAPDLASYVLVSPREIRDHYNRNIERFVQKGKTTFVWILFPATVFTDPADRLAAAEQCRALLAPPDAAPAGIAGRWPGCILQEEVVLSGSDREFHPRLSAFVEKAQAGEVSGVIALEGGLIVSKITEIIADKTLEFTDVQSRIATLLKDFKYMNARRRITWELVRKERIFRPADLFDRRQGRPQQPPAPGEAEAATGEE